MLPLSAISDQVVILAELKRASAIPLQTHPLSSFALCSKKEQTCYKVEQILSRCVATMEYSGKEYLRTFSPKVKYIQFRSHVHTLVRREIEVKQYFE